MKLLARAMIMMSRTNMKGTAFHREAITMFTIQPKYTIGLMKYRARSQNKRVAKETIIHMKGSDSGGNHIARIHTR